MAWDAQTRRESAEVGLLGARIGFGALMQFAEHEWREWNKRNDVPAGAEHSHYCCVAFLVECPGCKPAHDAGECCDWCCGAGRVTKRVAVTIADEKGEPRLLLSVLGPDEEEERALATARAEGAAAERVRWVLFLGLLDAALPRHPYEAKRAIAKKLREVADGGEGGG